MDTAIIIETIAVISGIFCVWLQTKEDIRAWPFGILSVLLYVYIFHENYLYSDMILNAIYILLNLYGWWNWSQRKHNDISEVPVGVLSVQNLFLTAVLILVGTLIWGWNMGQFTNAQFVYFDAFTTVGSLTAQYLLAKKYLDNWYIWIVVDLVAIPIYIAKGLYLTAGLFGVYLALCVYGLIQWRRQLKLYPA